MPKLTIVFQDGELLYADTPELHFDLPVLEAEILNVDSNGERAILPLAGIRQIVVGDVEPAPPLAELERWDRAAFHFLDGQVMRAWVGPGVRLGAHGGIWPVVEPNSGELRMLAVPYSALKGVFRLRQWDGRRPQERVREAPAAGHLDHVVRVLAEREVRANAPAHGQGLGLLERSRRRRQEEGAPPPGEAGAEPDV